MSYKRRNEQPPVFRRSAAGIPLFSPGPKGRIITAKMVQDAEDNEGAENRPTSHADRVFNRLRLAKEGKRKFVAISIRLPEDVIDDLKEIAPELGFSGYLALARSYIGRGLAEDLIRRDNAGKLAEGSDAADSR